VRSASVDFQSSERQPRRLIEARGIGKRYGERTIFAGVDLRLGPGTRLGLLGPNGCGKSTLIRVLVGEEAPSTGDVLRADGLAVAYFQQSREALDPELSVVDTLAPDGDHVTFRGARVHVRGYLERFLFRSEQLEMAVGRLSGGEQSRLLLAKLMLREAQVLVLDEPTNDLDLATLAVLEEALSGFDGAVLLVTHDRYFLDQVATSILAFMRTPAEPACERDAYAVVPFANLSQWEVARAEAASAKTMTAKTATAKAATETASGSQAASSSSAGAPAASARRRLGYLEQREYEGIEAEITRIEAVLREARVESDRPENASDAAGLMTLLATIAEREAALERLYARWAELEAKLTSTS
jgi:ATP-binding cassette subfamily F protein uup